MQKNGNVYLLHKCASHIHVSLVGKRHTLHPARAPKQPFTSFLPIWCASHCHRPSPSSSLPHICAAPPRSSLLTSHLHHETFPLSLFTASRSPSARPFHLRPLLAHPGLGFAGPQSHINRPPVHLPPVQGGDGALAFFLVRHLCARGHGRIERNETKEAEGTQELHPPYTRYSSRLITLFHLHHPPPWPGPCTLRGQSTSFLPSPRHM